MPVLTDISDLFFNTDCADAAVTLAGGEFGGYNQDELARIATDFLASLSRLGVAVPTAEELVDDYLLRC